MLSITFFTFLGAVAQGVWENSNLETHVDSLELVTDFDPVVLSEFMDNPHHQRTPFAVCEIVLVASVVKYLHHIGLA